MNPSDALDLLARADEIQRQAEHAARDWLREALADLDPRVTVCRLHYSPTLRSASCWIGSPSVDQKRSLHLAFGRGMATAAVESYGGNVRYQICTETTPVEALRAAGRFLPQRWFTS